MKASIGEALKEMKTQHGVALAELSEEQPVMLVFLRHFGCIFCMEAMKDIAERRSIIEGRGVKICLVHMSSNEIAEGYFAEYDLLNIDHVSDEECIYYERFGLLKANFGQLFGLRVWLRTAELAVKDLSLLRRKQIGDGLQMPGVFLIHEGNMLESYRHARASDRPDYDILSACCKTP